MGIKQNKDNYANYQEIVSNWRLQRKVMLLDKQWPTILNQLKEKFAVYGLTKLDTGKFGNISSMEEWRYEELKGLGIEFSENSEIPSSTSQGSNGAVFFKGIFITGELSKSQTLGVYWNIVKGHIVVMIDDRIEHLKDIQKFCEEHSISFIGILFEGLENFREQQGSAVFNLQKEYLIQHAQWLEDEEAMQMLDSAKEMAHSGDAVL
jgi:hypothetical protein